jgi:hypothetical protein
MPPAYPSVIVIVFVIILIIISIFIVVTVFIIIVVHPLFLWSSYISLFTYVIGLLFILETFLFFF